MTRLTEALERVTAVVEIAAERAVREEFSTPVPGYRDQPRRISGSTALLAIPGIGEIMRERFSEIPDERVAAGADREVTVRCTCSRELNVGYGQLVRCGGCWRFYFNGKSVEGTEPPAPADVVLCDDCEDCIPFKDGAWIRVAGEDRYLCPGCHDHAVSTGDVDLFEERR